jgi:hypothetical protein
LKQSELGLERVKADVADIVNSINQELIVIQKVADDFEELARDDDAPLEQVVQDSKFQRFLSGLLVIEHILQLQA